MDIDNSAYVQYEGLKLPNERQRELTNQQVNWRGWGVPITAPGEYYWPDAAERGMKDENNYYNDKFFYIQALYRKGLDRMLVEEFGLYGYDREISRQSNRFAAKDIEAAFSEAAELYYWPSFSMMNLDYIYLRNSVHVERLEEEDLRLFEEAYETQATEISDGMQEVIERTWKFFINADREGGSHRVWYSRGGPSRDDPTSDTLMLEIRIGDNFTAEDKDENGFILEIPLNEHIAGEKIVREEIAPRMVSEISQKAGIPVKIRVIA